MTTIQQILKGGTYLSDGAWGTEFLKKGYKIGDSADLLNRDHPALVRDVAISYVNAGSDIILTNTFGANRIGLSKYGLDKRLQEINQAGLALSVEAAAERCAVFASMGPTGKMVSMGELSLEEAEAVFREQAEALMEAGAEAVVLETMSDLEEFRAALKGVKQTGLPVIGCMSFDSGKDFHRTMMGVSVEQMIETAEACGADMLGANCGVGIENYIGIAKTLLEKSRLPVWIKANAGLPRMENGRTVYDMAPALFGKYVAELAGLGVRVIGGCCGTTPEHIRSARQALTLSAH